MLYEVITGYGRGLEEARVRLARANGLGWRVRAALSVFGRQPLWRLTLTLGRWLRATGLPRRLGRRAMGPMGLLASSEPATGFGPNAPTAGSRTQAATPAAKPRVASRSFGFISLRRKTTAAPAA